MPNDGFLPQISQTDAMMNVLLDPSSHPLRDRRKAKDHCSIASNDLFYVAVRPGPAHHNFNIWRAFALHKEVINRLNVYPVPDGDTGTNMSLTVESVLVELEQLNEDASMSLVCQAIAHGSLMGARGNSGVILSQLLRGLMERFRSCDEISPELLAESLEHADVLARQAVVRPVEGTILSIARAGALGAREATGSLTNEVRSARDHAREALAYTPSSWRC